mmetsp:Transcript_12744/g.26350  ORF Transcript_12744/g.26350 Transcript_12744/m.26350 type:complete len:89 (+) Transcript_12744:1346-1612(+)
MRGLSCAPGLQQRVIVEGRLSFLLDHKPLFLCLILSVLDPMVMADPMGSPVVSMALVWSLDEICGHFLFSRKEASLHSRRKNSASVRH